MTYISRGNFLDNVASFALFLHVITGMQDPRKIVADQMALQDNNLFSFTNKIINVFDIKKKIPQNIRISGHPSMS